MIWKPNREHVTLSELVKIRHGWPFRSEAFSQELTGRPIVVSIGNFNYTGGFRFGSTATKEYREEYPREFELIPGDLLVVMTCQTPGGEILGIPARTPGDGRIYLHNQRMGKVVVRDSKRVDVAFLYWLFLSREFNRELVATASGSKILHTSPSRIAAFGFDLPSIREQQGIAKILGALDDKIELNRRTNETLEAMARALFKSWFVDFDPVHANKAGRAPAGMNAATASEFPNQLTESPLGMIPEGWTVGPIGQAVRVAGGSTPSTSNPAFWDGEFAWTRPKDISDAPNKLLLATERTVTQAGLDTISSGLLPPGAVLLSSRAPIGYIAYARIPVAINQGYIELVCNGDTQLTSLYVLHWLEFAMDEIKGRAGGTTFPEISKGAFRTISTLIPPRSLLSKFDAAIKPNLDKVEVNARTSMKLKQLRDALLPKLLSGELRVPEAERIVGKAV